MGTEEGQVFHPDMVDDNSEDRPVGLDKLDCFFDSTRMCNPSCMAFITYPRGEQKELSDMQQHCAVLLFGERLARHTAIIASTLVASDKRRNIAEQDRQRAESLGSSGPFASPFPATPRVKP